MTVNNKTTYSDNRRIAKNTLMLYFRHILIMLVTLYTVRVVLNTLGVEDYGIYTVVGGVVTMFSFFNATMASASQRFFSFAIGEGDSDKLRKLFSVNWIIYGLISIIALVLLETIGLWFVQHKLLIPENRVNAALWIYHFSVLSFLCSILRTPFMAMIIAHEDMNIYAYVSILEALLKLGVVYLLMIVAVDKLELYGVLVFISTLISSSVFAVIGMKKYKECSLAIIWNKKLFKEVFSFTGWSIYGSITVVIRNQAVTILLNQMFNPIVAGARAIALQVAGTVNVFASNFNTGLYPPIIKNYAAGKKQEVLKLMFNGSKITFFLMYVFTLPLIIYMPYVLDLWLKNPPEGTVIFTRLALVDTLITAVSLPLMTAVRATGRVKVYELTLGSILILSFLVSWVILYLGAEAYSVMVVAVVATSIMFIFRLFLLKRILRFSIKQYLKEVVQPLILMSVISLLISLLISKVLPYNFIYICISIILSLTITCLTMYFIVMNSSERKKIQSVILNKLKNK